MSSRQNGVHPAILLQASQGFVGGVGKSYKWLVCGYAGANSLSFDETKQ
jgi:hypothetical protein